MNNVQIQSNTEDEQTNKTICDNRAALINAIDALFLSRKLLDVFDIMCVELQKCNCPILSRVAAIHGYSQAQFSAFCSQLQKYGFLTRDERRWSIGVRSVDVEQRAKLEAMNKDQLIDVLLLYASINSHLNSTVSAK